MKLKLAWDGKYSCRLHIKICGSKSCSILFSYLAFPHVQVVQMILTAYPGAKSDDKFNYFWMGLEWVNQFSYQPETPYGFSCELNHCCLGVEKFPLILHLIFVQIELLMKFKFRYRLRKNYDSSEFFAKPLCAIFCQAKFSILDKHETFYTQFLCYFSLVDQMADHLLEIVQRQAVDLWRNFTGFRFTAASLHTSFYDG